MSTVPFPGSGAPEEEDEPVILYDEDGQAVRFSFLDTVERGDRTWIVLAPEDGGDGVVIMEMVADPEEEDSYTFYPVESDRTLQSVFREFRRKNGLDTT